LARLNKLETGNPKTDNNKYNTAYEITEHLSDDQISKIINGETHLPCNEVVEGETGTINAKIKELSDTITQINTDKNTTDITHNPKIENNPSLVTSQNLNEFLDYL
jgi:hypothetical protein